MVCELLSVGYFVRAALKVSASVRFLRDEGTDLYLAKLPKVLQQKVHKASNNEVDFSDEMSPRKGTV